MWTNIKAGLAWLKMSVLWASIGVYFRLTFTIDHFMRFTRRAPRRRKRAARTPRLIQPRRPRPAG